MDDAIPFLKATLPLIWCRETASLHVQAFWSDLNPALGQSDVTALLVQQLCGGEILRATTKSHGACYSNRLPDGTELDLTEMQYPEGTPVPRGDTVSRDDVLKGYIAKRLQTYERYELLLSRYKEHVPAPDDDD